MGRANAGPLRWPVDRVAAGPQTATSNIHIMYIHVYDEQPDAELVGAAFGAREPRLGGGAALPAVVLAAGRGIVLEIFSHSYEVDLYY